MKKFFRNLFSGYFLVILLLLIELGAFVAVQFFLEDIVTLIVGQSNNDLVSSIVTLVYFGLRVLIFIVAFIIFFKIIYKQEDPEFKIPWIIGMLLFPFLCSVLFLIFGNHGLNKRDKRLVKANRKAYDEYCLISTKRQERYKQELGAAAGAFNYINNTTGLFATKHNVVTYYKNGTLICRHWNKTCLCFPTDGR